MAAAGEENTEAHDGAQLMNAMPHSGYCTALGGSSAKLENAKE